MQLTAAAGPEEEAAAGSLVAQARNLASRRGHAHVTPLHIASAILSASPALLLRSSNSIHNNDNIDALALSLGAALDGLPVVTTTSPSPAPAPAAAPSNAFLAALKRARKKRRRRSSRAAAGSSEVERLVASVLLDPSVDRALRSAASLLLRPSSDPDPVPDRGTKQLARRHQRPAAVVPNGSENQAIKVKPRPSARGTTKLGHNKLLTRSTHRGRTSNIQAACRQPKFTELTAENHKILCGALMLRVPWHGAIFPGISTVVLLCRSGMTRRARENLTSSSSRTTATWLLFQGRDNGGGNLVARELARLVFGSYSEFTALEVLGNSDIITPTRNGKQIPAIKGKRSLLNNDCGGYVGERLFEAIRENPHRVILINGVNRLDRDSKTFVKNAVKEGTVRGCNGEVVSLEDVIVVLMNSEVVDSGSSVLSSPQMKRPRLGRQSLEEGDDIQREEVRSRRLSIDLNASPEPQEDDEDDSAEENAGITDVVDGVFFFN
ncbi:protein SMAX1-LIKE 3-like [Brachypodium distachyon]|nr:protein SMAX1-LIKE 3-like [Brachypodium distachyon]|eukprot:XP_024310742.1 protein SMAX1-LIKE 3-like [Brachypodium distachyon]